MANETTSGSTEPTAPTAPAHTDAFVTVEKKRKKKRKYTRGTRTFQELEMGTSRAAGELAKAVSKGLSTYRRRRDKSSRKRKDGALRDLLNNTGKAVSRGLRAGSEAPYEFAKAVNSRRFSKQLRDAVRIVLPPVFY